MSKEDYYKTLGVDKSANADSIKKAYRSLAMKYHPDKNPGDKIAEQKFKEISEAYEVLKDEQKRASYDRFGHSAFDGGASAHGNRGFDFNNGNFSDIFGDIFNDFMGGGSSNSYERNNKGSDLRYNIQISLEEAYKGKQETVNFKTHTNCTSCKSTGSTNGSEPISCSICKGAGKVRTQQGFFAIEKTCSNCRGAGKIIKDPCKTCHGEGRYQKDKTISVSIPSGVTEGTKIRVSGEGEAGIRGGTFGDLYIFVTISPHKLFTVEDSNLYCKFPIPMTVAALGGSIEVPCIDGSKAKISIPVATQTGNQFRLRGKGMSKMRSSSFGELYVYAVVQTPTNLTKRQKELLQEFQKEESPNKDDDDGFFKKVKDLWE